MTSVDEFLSRASAFAKGASPAASPTPPPEEAPSAAAAPAAEEASSEDPAEPEASTAAAEVPVYTARQRARLAKRAAEVSDVENRLRTRWAEGLKAIDAGDAAGADAFLQAVSGGKASLASLAGKPAETTSAAVKIALGSHPVSKVPGYAGALREILAESAVDGRPTKTLKQAADELMSVVSKAPAKPAAKPAAKAPKAATPAPAPASPPRFATSVDPIADPFLARARDFVRTATTKGFGR